MKRTMFIVFIVGIYRMINGGYKNPGTRIGKKITLKTSGNEYTIFKQTNMIKKENTASVYFEIEFQFKESVPKIFSPTIPFFVGMPGFISKLWLVDEKTGAYAGQYVFASEADAIGYGNSAAQRLVKSLCIPGSYNWRIINF